MPYLQTLSAALLFTFLLGCRTVNNVETSPTNATVAIDRSQILNAMLEANQVFYKSGEIYEVPYGVDSGGKKLPPNPTDPSTCYNSCPKDRWSPLICTYFCQFPAYSDVVVPNIRGCFVRVVQYLKVPVEGEASRTLSYNEAYDYCVFSNYDAVKKRIPAFDPAEIAKNKAAGNKPGVMKWVDDHQKDIFRQLMFTNGNPNAFDKSDVEWILTQFKSRSGFGAANY